MQWALYGDAALPNKGKEYRLSPIDLDVPNGETVPISVEMDFETTTSKTKENQMKRYQLIRSVEETTEGHKQNHKITLRELTETGAASIKTPEAEIARLLLPPDLREVFFTDGDSALNFIESDSPADKRKQVEDAIRSLLGLDVIESAIKHVKNTSTDLLEDSKEIEESNKELTEVVTKLKEVNKEIERCENERDDAKLQFDKVNQSLEDIDKKIEAAYEGEKNHEALNRQRQETKAALKEIRNQEEKLMSEHSLSFRKLPLFRDLLTPVLEQSFKKLNELRDQGKPPSLTIPVLAERLKGVTCICGDSLDKHSTDGKRRREHIEQLISESQETDERQKCLTDLYYGSLALKPIELTNEQHWIAEYKGISIQRDELKEKRVELEGKLKALNVQLKDIGGIDISALRAKKQEYIAQCDRLNKRHIEHKIKLENMQGDRISLTATHNNLLKKEKTGKQILARLDATNDISQILQNSYNRIKNEERQEVSRLMNTLFLKMIGVDPDQGAIIQRAEISEDFDILVYGPNNKSLKPNSDLNGASRRALTLAFILALTKVSKVIAPNVIDTPLGMMAGFVKDSVLKTAIQESSQLILFLTRSEIKDCEDIIEDNAGCVITITNSAQYPKILVNDPNMNEPQAFRCECEDLGECERCKQRTNDEVEIAKILGDEYGTSI